MPRLKQASTAIFINKHHPDSAGECVVSIRVTFARKRRYYDVGKKMTDQDFHALFSPKLRQDQRALFLSLTAEQQRAQDIIDELKTTFTWERFESAYIKNSSIGDTLRGAFDAYIDTMDTERQYATSVSYETARNSFDKFMPGAMIGDVTPGYLRRYEAWMLEEGKGITSVGIYCRALRSVLNWVIGCGKLSRELYPFGKAKEKKYEIPTGRNPKKALPVDDIAAIFRYECEPGSRQEMARDYWIFRYLANGIDMKDFCLLKWSQYRDDGIHFVRSKTANTKRVREATKIPVHPEMLDIMHRWGNANKGKDQHIFPHLEPGMNAEQIRNSVQLLTKLVNKYMRQITADLGIKKPALTKDARHSFATVLKNSGAPVALIGELLVHSQPGTTQAYLDSFEDNQVLKHTEALTVMLRKKAVNE